MRGLSTVAAFVVLLFAFAAIFASVFFFYNLLLGATQKGVEAIYSSVFTDSQEAFTYSNSACGVTGGGIYYILQDEKGAVLYNGTTPPCPPATRGIYVIRAVRRDGSVGITRVAVGGLRVEAVSQIAYLGPGGSVSIQLRIRLMNPNNTYVPVDRITISNPPANLSCRVPAEEVPLNTVIGPNEARELSIGTMECNATRDYLIDDRRTVNISTTVYYRGLPVDAVTSAVLTVVDRFGTASFNITSPGRCVLNIPVSKALQYAVAGPGKSLPGLSCPWGAGDYTYKALGSDGVVYTAPVSVRQNSIYAWAEANRTVTYVSSTGQSFTFSLYLRFSNKLPAYVPFNYTYRLIYDTNLLSCTTSKNSGMLVLAPGETRAVDAGAVTCTVLRQFDEASIGALITAAYNYSGGSVVLYSGVVGGPSYAGQPNWVVMRVLWRSAAVGTAPGASVVEVQQRKALFTVLWTPTAPPPRCPLVWVYPYVYLWPLLSWSSASAQGYNVTTLTLKAMPNWPEQYDVASLAANMSGWSASLNKTLEIFSGDYRVYLGGVLQLSPTQSSGQPVALPAALGWYVNTQSPGVVEANATLFGQRRCTSPLLRLAVSPMALAASKTFQCTTSQAVDNYNTYNTVVSCRYWDFERSFPYNRTVTYQSSISLSSSKKFNGTRSLFFDITQDWGYAVFYIDVRQWLGVVPASASFSIYINPNKRPDASRYYQVSFFIDRDGDGKPDLELIYYARRGGYIQLSPLLGFSTTTTVGGTFNVKAGKWRQFTLSSIYPTGHLVGIALSSSGKADADVYWDSMKLCPQSYFSNAPYATVVADGWTSTGVYIDTQRSPTTPPSLALEVDAADNTGDVLADYGIAAFIYNVTKWLGAPIPAYGTSIAVKVLYQRDVKDVRNNVYYMSLGVDTNGDGTVDKEVVYYTPDTAVGPGVVVSLYFTNSTGDPLVVCTVDTAGNCAVTNSTIFAAYKITSFNTTTIAPQLPGAVLYIGLAAVDAMGYSDGAVDDFWVFWDDLTVTYSACGLPAGWGASGRYAWQSYGYLLVTGNAVVNTSLVSGGLTYISNFTGSGLYAVFDPLLSPIFGVYKSGSSFSAYCLGSSTPLGVFPA
ncbi:MAG: hypothetical protein QXJ71_02005, partial [Pyrobaculum sp.]